MEDGPSTGGASGYGQRVLLTFRVFLNNGLEAILFVFTERALEQ